MSNNAEDSAAAERLLAPLYDKDTLQRLTPGMRNRLARIEACAFPEEVKAALRARVFGQPDIAERIRAACPWLFTRTALQPLRHTIPL